MTRKDFELIARTPNVRRITNGDNATELQWMADVTRLADALAGTNSGFDRARFLKACGYAQ